MCQAEVGNSGCAKVLTAEMIRNVNKEQFRNALHLGLGQAIIYARDHDVDEFRDVILDACLHCYSCDPQCEGTRSAYMLEVVNLLSEKNFYYDAVLKSLPEDGDTWNTVQRFHFAACLALEGNEAAIRLMYESYKPGPSMGELIGIDFLHLGGINGLLFVAEGMGALLMTKPERVDIGYLLSVSIDECGEQETLDALRKAGEQNPRIEAYRLAAEARERKALRPSEKPPVWSESYEQIKSRLPEINIPLLRLWGERANNEDFDLAAHGLIAARNAKEQAAYLHIFGRRQFPLDPSVLLPLVEIEEEQIGFAAASALTHIAHPAVRELAFRLVETRSELRLEAVDLLARNYQAGDRTTMLRWFDKEQEPTVLHSYAMDMEDFWKAHPDEESEVPMLLALYAKGPCSFCREGVVRRLIELNALTEELRAECAYDANDDVRELVTAEKAGSSLRSE